MNTATDAATIKRAAAGKWPEILSSLGGISAEILDGKHHPCPKCNGTDRFRMIDEERGALFCNQCFNKKNPDGIAALQWLNDEDFRATLKRLADHLGVNGRGAASKPKIVATYDYHNEEGKYFLHLFKRYLNRDSYGIMIKGRRPVEKKMEKAGYKDIKQSKRWMNDVGSIPLDVAEYWGLYLKAKLDNGRTQQIDIGTYQYYDNIFSEYYNNKNELRKTKRMLEEHVQKTCDIINDMA